jgi:tryptophanyl-tRNA synthetase
MGAGDFGLNSVDALLAAERSGDGRYFRVIAIVADSHRHSADEIDTLDVLQKAVHKMLARLLAVRDDIDPGVFLLLER